MQEKSNTWLESLLFGMIQRMAVVITELRTKKKNTTKQQQTPAEPQEWLNSGDAFNLDHYFNSASKQQSHLDTVSTSVLLQQG